MDPGPAICEQTGYPKKQQKTSRQKVINLIKMVSNWGPQGRPKFGQFLTFSHLFAPGAEMGRESSRAPKKVARSVQKVPKGSQKVAKSHGKDIQKASTRHPNAISRCIGNSVATSISNAIANAIPTAVGNRSPRHGGGKAEGNWIIILYFHHILLFLFKLMISR